LHIDFKYLGGNNDSCIEMRRSKMHIPGIFIAAIDNAQPNLAFIGHIFRTSDSTQTGTFGGIVYFDENGRQRGRMKTFSCCVFDGDDRDSLPRTDDPKNQTFSFITIPWLSLGVIGAATVISDLSLPS
jgi:hypothetical protein